VHNPVIIAAELIVVVGIIAWSIDWAMVPWLQAGVMQRFEIS
jgi:hypothetical protein